MLLWNESDKTIFVHIKENDSVLLHTLLTEKKKNRNILMCVTRKFGFGWSADQALTLYFM